MKLYFLPNGFKKAGIIIFIIFSIPSAVCGFTDGFFELALETTHQNFLRDGFLGITITESFFIFCDIVALFGLMVFILAKEKKFDEFLLKIRFESVQIIFTLSLITMMILVLFKQSWNINSSWIIELQMIGYIIVYQLKKRSFSPSEAYEESTES